MNSAHKFSESRWNLIFALSGASALIYQLVWFRLLSFLTGSSSIALTVTLAYFMFGLGAGSVVAGFATQKISFPVKLYVACELLLFCFGILSFYYIGTAHVLSVSALFNPFTAKFLVPAVVLIPPTFMMGATLPLISGALRDCRGKAVGEMYAFNTLGAAIGVITAGFFIIPGFGLRAALLSAATLNLLAGILALTFYHVPAENLSSDKIDDLKDNSPALLSLIFFVVGVTGLGAEVIWTRWITLLFRCNSVYALTIILSIFLLGIYLGSKTEARRVISDPWQRLSMLLFGWAGSTLLAVLLVICMPDASKTANPPLLYVSVVALLLIPCFFGGALIPAGIRIFESKKVFSKALGINYSLNTIGCVLGTASATYLLLPRYGLPGSLALLSGLCACLGVFAWDVGNNSLRKMVLTALVVIATFIGAKNLAIHLTANSTKEVLLDIQAPEASIAVAKNIQDENLQLYVNGDWQAGSSPHDQVHLRMLGHLPSLFSARTQSALVVGLGAGFTLTSLVSHPFEEITAVEISSSMPQATALFKNFQGNPLDDRRVQLVFDDGRGYLQSATRCWDVITTDPVDPEDAGATNLYSVEYYHLVKSKLCPGGAAAQWLNPHYTTPDFSMLVKSFLTAFPHSFLWDAGYTTVILGTKDGLQKDKSAIDLQIHESNVEQSLRTIGVESTSELLSRLMAGPARLKQLTEDAELNTDLFPRIEYAILNQVVPGSAMGHFSPNENEKFEAEQELFLE